MKYEMVKVNHTYAIKEIATGHVIRSYYTEVKAAMWLRRYNNGYGFQGWTPHFMLVKV
jgi:hypothetical protein